MPGEDGGIDADPVPLLHSGFLGSEAEDPCGVIRMGREDVEPAPAETGASEQLPQALNERPVDRGPVVGVHHVEHRAREPMLVRSEQGAAAAVPTAALGSISTEQRDPDSSATE